MEIRSILKKIKAYDAYDGKQHTTEDYVSIPTCQKDNNAWFDFGVKESTDFALAGGAYQQLDNTISSLNSLFWVRTIKYPAMQYENEPQRSGMFCSYSAGIAPTINIPIRSNIVDFFRSGYIKNIEYRQKDLVDKILSGITTIDLSQSLTLGQDDLDGLLVKAYVKLGKYVSSAVHGVEEECLERAYNNGKLSKYMRATDRYYVSNAYVASEEDGEFRHKLNPEFEYIDDNGEKRLFVRGVNRSRKGIEFSQEYVSSGLERPMWFRVEPIEYEIVNWHKLPKYINPKGNGTANVIKLESTRVITPPMPFNHIDSKFNMCERWDYSIISAFLNGYNNIAYADGKSKIIDADAGNDFTQTGGFISESLSDKNITIKDFYVPKIERNIGDYAFAGCVGLNSVHIPNNIILIGKNAFDDCSFNYAYSTIKDGKTDEFVLSRKLPENTSNITNVIDLSKLKMAYTSINYNMLRDPEILEVLDDVTNLLIKEKIRLPMIFAFKMAEYGIFDYDANFKFFKKELREEIDIVSRFPDDEQFSFYAFCYALGCFSNRFIKDNYFQDTNVLISQKSCGLLRNLISKGIISIDQIHSLFVGEMDSDVSKKLVFPTIFTQNFIKFLGETHNNMPMEGARLLTSIEETHPGAFRLCLENFDCVQDMRCRVDSNGNPRMTTWKDAIISAHGGDCVYAGINKFNEDIALAFHKANIPQDDFEIATSLRVDMRAEKVPAHLIGKPLRQKTVLEEIDDIRKGINSDLTQIHDTCIDYTRNFSFEWLNKYDARNFLVGIFASCCSVISSGLYGSYIAKYSAVAKDLQNVIIRDKFSKEMGKATIYIRPSNGYAVVNEFDINRRYRRHEYEFLSGVYKVSEDDQQEIIRQEIYETFLKAIMCFVEEFNLAFPNTPINIVTVGMGANKLKKQCYQLPSIQPKFVPEEYFFVDAQAEQRVLYTSNAQTAFEYQQYINSDNNDIVYQEY